MRGIAMGDGGGETYNTGVVHGKFRDLAELRAFAGKLIEMWDRNHAKPFNMKSEYAEAAGPLIWSYTQHVVELMRSVLELSQQNRMIIAVPLMRLMVENSMTSIWLLLSPQATRAVLHEGLRQRKAALANILEIESEGFDQSDIDDINRDIERFASDSLPAGKSFEQRCRQIVDGLGTYVTWRVMSSFSHAGLAMGDFYLKETDRGPIGIAFDSSAKLEHHEAWLGTAVCMLITSLKACNEIDSKGSHKTQVERAAKRMGITLDFRLIADGADKT